MYQLEQGLGKALRAKEVAQYLDVNVKTVIKYYRELGGIRLGRHYRFFEKEVYYAIQKRTEVDSPSEERKPEIGKGVFDKKGSQRLGIEDEAKASGRLEQEDRHGLFR